MVGIAVAQVPDNDRCIQREKLRPYEPVYGNVTEANYDYNNQGVCGARSDRPSVWYEVRGRNADVTVKVCTNNDVITDFGVFTKCNTQLCLGHPGQTTEPSNCEDNESANFTWFAENNVQYFVHVRSDVQLNNEIGSNFTIVYEDASLDGPIDDDEPANDDEGNEGEPGGPGNGGGDSGSSISIGLTIMAGISSAVALCL